VISFAIKDGLDTARTGGGVKLIDEAAKECLHAAFLRGSDLGGNGEVGQTHQSLADGFQVLLARGEGRRGGGAGVRLRAQQIQGSLKKGTAVLFVGHTVGGHQSERLARFQPVVVDAVQDGILILGRQAAQGVSHRGAELSLCEHGLRQGRQACGDIPTAGDPLGFSTQQAGDGGGAETVFTEQGIDHTPLVQRGEGAGR